MKKMIVILASFLLPLIAFNQTAGNDSYSSSKNEMARKSTMVLPWVLTGGGAVMLVTGISVHGSKQSYSPNEEIGLALIIAGSAAVLTGIVIFSSSAKCGAGEKMFSTYFKMEKAGKLEKVRPDTGIADSYFPALSFRMGL